MNGTIRKPLLALQALVLAFAGIGIGSLAAAKTHPQATAGAGTGVAYAATLVMDPGAPSVPTSPNGSGFTYQGRLTDGGTPANGDYDFAFSLHDDPFLGNLVGGPITHTNQTVADGLFTLLLDFGFTPFQGEARYVQISVRPAGIGGYTTFLPRTAVRPAPYALFAHDVPPYDNVIMVSPSGGDFTTITAALASITDNSPTNRYLIWVGPGVYPGQVFMKEYVDIEGAGELLTKITSPGFGPQTATLLGANNAELRSLTVENTGGNTWAIAMRNNSDSPSLLHVTFISSGGTGGTYGVLNATSSPTLLDVTIIVTGTTSTYGMVNSTSSPTMMGGTLKALNGTSTRGVYNSSNSAPVLTGVTITASGPNSNIGVYSDNSNPTMSGVTVTASDGSSNYAVYNSSSAPKIANSILSGTGASNNYGVFNTVANGTRSVTIDNSTITGSTATIRNEAQYFTLVGSSKLAGGAVNTSGGGTVTCAGVHDENYTFFASACP